MFHNLNKQKSPKDETCAGENSVKITNRILLPGSPPGPQSAQTAYETARATEEAADKITYSVEINGFKSNKFPPQKTPRGYGTFGKKNFPFTQ